MSKPNAFLGIDPGKSGHIAAIDIEMTPLGSIELSSHESEIFRFIEDLSRTHNIAFTCIETVRSSPQMGVTSAFNFGQSYGTCRGIIAAMRLPFIEARPQKWMKAMDCMTGGDKNVTRHKALELWPGIKFNKSGKSGHYDAMLLAEYARRVWGAE